MQAFVEKYHEMRGFSAKDITFTHGSYYTYGVNYF